MAGPHATTHASGPAWRGVGGVRKMGLAGALGAALGLGVTLGDRLLFSKNAAKQDAAHY